MRVLNTLYLTEPGLRVSVRHQSLEVRRDRALVTRFPLEGLEGVIAWPRIEFTTEALGRCAARGIRVAQLGPSGKLRFSVSGATRGNVMLRVAQLRAADTPDAAAEIARSIVAGKLQNQRRMLLRWSWDASGTTRMVLNTERMRIEDQLATVRTARDGDHLRGIEGNASRSYFKGMGAHLERVAPHMTFTNRSRRPPLDPVNALLSYCYGLAVAESTGALDAVGLDPQIGYLHLLRPGRPSLALDLVEELRPLADRFAVRLLSTRVLQPTDFDHLVTGAVRLSDAGRRLVLKNYEDHRSQDIVHPLLKRLIPRASLVAVQATLLARTIRGDTPRYPPFVMEV
jgi:CRISPR-associated protein Cas1